MVSCARCGRSVTPGSGSSRVCEPCHVTPPLQYTVKASLGNGHVSVITGSGVQEPNLVRTQKVPATSEVRQTDVQIFGLPDPGGAGPARGVRRRSDGPRTGKRTSGLRGVTAAKVADARRASTSPSPSPDPKATAHRISPSARPLSYTEPPRRARARRHRLAQQRTRAARAPDVPGTLPALT